ncbi:ferredoxin-thioredoxin reductase catalytic chain, chloroplastic isoform X2 [Henckelia pumila]|uniref:ferredoxin-thioredoxin reductase catalytic chain, chloroplastic isoform X2 n=1 Tax=Henckelia pumila TaxID=405737 RepID=UPI003C6E28AA
MIFFRFENPLFLSLELTGKLIVIFVDTSYAMLWKRSMFFLLTLYFFSPLNRERQIKEILAMRALQASTSYSVGFGVSSLDSRSIPSRYRHIMSAKVEPTEKSVEVMRKFSEQYARKSGTYFCVDKSVTSVVIKGLAEHKDTLGAPLCPCTMMIKLLRHSKVFGTVLVFL